MSVFTRTPLHTEEGIARFSDSDFYWSLTIPRENLQRLIPLLGKLPLVEACREAGVESHYITGYYRSDFIYHLPYREGGDFRVLDLGSGFGNITIPLAKRMPDADIYAADGSYDILRLLNARARAEGCTNITALQTEAFEHMSLPFAPGTFDLILMNGVLEWIGAGVTEGNPEEHQERVLAYLRTLLKPGGALYIGIEARYFLGYITGVRDPHSQLRFTSIVPRWLANVIARRAGKPEGYRTYTHSHQGYRKLLRKAGFTNDSVETIYSIASYKDPYFLFSFREKNAYRFAFTKWARQVFPTPRGRFAYRILYLLGLEKLFAPGFLFLARTEGAEESSLLAQVLNPVLRELNATLSDFEVLKIDGNKGDDGCVNFLLFPRGEKNPTYFAKVKRDGVWHTTRTQALKEAESLSDTLILPAAESPVAEIYPYISFTPTVRTWAGVEAVANAVKDLHAKGLVHGDLTIENAGTLEGKTVLFDLERLGKGEASDDLFSLVLHYFAYVQKLRGKALALALKGKEVRALLGLSEDDYLTQLRSFVHKEEERYRTLRPYKAGLYQELARVL